MGILSPPQPDFVSTNFHHTLDKLQENKHIQQILLCKLKLNGLYIMIECTLNNVFFNHFELQNMNFYDLKYENACGWVSNPRSQTLVTFMPFLSKLTDLSRQRTK